MVYAPRETSPLHALLLGRHSPTFLPPVWCISPTLAMAPTASGYCCKKDAARSSPNTSQASAPAVFLDITDKVSREKREGLLGLAFDPSYPRNRYFYVYCSAANPRRSIIPRFSVSTVDPNKAEPTTELVLLEVTQPFSQHESRNLGLRR